MLTLLAALQLAAAPPWKTVEIRRWQWQPGRRAYTVRIEAREPATSSDDPQERIRISVPGRPDFTYVDTRGPGGFVTAAEGLGAADSAVRQVLKPLGSRLATLPAGPRHGAILVAFGYAYASDPGLLVAITVDTTGYPRTLVATETDLVTIEHPGSADEEWVLQPSVPQGIGAGACSATYDPFHVWAFPGGGRPLREDSAATVAYNTREYVWAGFDVREDVRVVGCKPGEYRVQSAPQ